MATPAHYIRTIHSSLSAHTPASAAWASTAQYHLNHHNSSSNPNPNTTHNHAPLPRHQHPSSQLGYQSFTHTPSISTHNTHMYTHHLRDLTHPSPPPTRAASGAQGPTPPPPGMVMAQQGQYVASPHQLRKPLPTRTPPSPPPTSRRRSASVRMPPAYKFDPFGDEPPAPVAGFASSGGGGAMPLTSSSQANVRALSLPSATVTASEAVCAEVDVDMEVEADISSAGPTSSHPYTIHIPAAAPNDIKLYTPSPPPRSPRLSARAPAFYPTPPSPISPPAARTNVGVPRQTSSYPAPNLSKIVAGMLLNRVHAAKPMRRRVGPAGGNGRQYVKSCLSSVVSVEA